MAELTLKKKLTRAEFKKRAYEVIAKLNTEVEPFSDISEEAIRKRRACAKEDPFYFFQTYLPHYFDSEFALFHDETIALLEKRPDVAKHEVVVPVAIAAPREFAKSTITSFGYSLHQICNSLRHFIILGSDTEDLASDLAGYIYIELLYNERIKCDYGELVEDNISVDDFVTKNDVRVKARGRGQRIRGLKHKQHRPDLVILDDMENDQNVKNPRIVKSLLDWIKGTVYAGIDKSGSLFIIGTILAKRSALSQIIKAEEEPWNYYERRLYRAIQDDGTSLWPAKFPIEVLRNQKKLMGSVAFNKEKMNDPRDDEGAFQEEWIRYYPFEIMRRLSLIVVGFFDPSVEAKASADYKSIITVGLDRKEMLFYVLDAFIRRCSIDQAIRAAYTRHDEFHYYQFGLEDNVFQKLLLRDFDRAAKDKGYHLPVRGITHTIAKETRILGLSPLVERGKVLFAKNNSDQNLLIEQLIFFPSPTVNDDGPDALEGAVSLLQGGASMPQIHSAGTRQMGHDLDGYHGSVRYAAY